jgi:hypothetical protein
LLFSIPLLVSCAQLWRASGSAHAVFPRSCTYFEFPASISEPDTLVSELSALHWS